MSDTTNTMVVIRVETNPVTETSNGFESLTDLVGGYIEHLYLKHPDGIAVMYLNEDGKRLGLSLNPIANRLAHLYAGISEDDLILGDVAIVGPPDFHYGNDTNAPAWAVKLVTDYQQKETR